MTRPPHILVVSPVPSHPPDQGNAARILTLATELKERGVEQEFFYYGMEGLTDNQRNEMQAFWSDFHFMPSIALPRPKFARYWGVDDWCPDGLRAAVAKLHTTRQYDAVLINYVWMSRVLVDLRNTFRIIDSHDVFGDRHLVSIREGLEPRWFFTSVEEEDRGFGRSDLVIGIQECETASIRARITTDVMTVGHFMAPLFLTSSFVDKPIATFGYLGSANPWNVKSIISLDSAIGPDSNLDWLLAGTITKKTLALQSNPYLLGMVARLDEFYRRVHCVVNPMMGGTGLKIKTIEALGFGKPILGTADAFQGLPVRHDAHRLANVHECVDCMELYSRNPAFRQELALASRRLYLDYIRDVECEMSRLYSAILSRRRLDSQVQVFRTPGIVNTAVAPQPCTGKNSYEGRNSGVGSELHKTTAWVSSETCP